MTIDRLSMTDRKQYEKRYYQTNKERINAKSRAWRVANQELVKSYELEHRYGITLEEFNGLCLIQENCCAICGEITDKPYVDHDHSDGRIRGLLCSSCNKGIGFFKDSPEKLRAAANYLEK